MRTYTTVQGDTWDLIAYKVYGDEKLMSVLIEANPTYLETVIFSAGVTLNIPEVVPVEETIKPPWMR